MCTYELDHDARDKIRLSKMCGTIRRNLVNKCRRIPIRQWLYGGSVLYVSETWVMSDEDKAAEMKFLRGVKRCTGLVHTKITEIKEGLGIY